MDFLCFKFVLKKDHIARTQEKQKQKHIQIERKLNIEQITLVFF